MSRAVRAVLLTIATVALATPAHAQIAGCTTCIPARYWEIDRDFWKRDGGDPAPEAARLAARKPVDLGIAFSGGGTRSASATLGELRGLNANGWLSRVRYVSAVSGGSWAAIPFAFYRGTLVDLLGGMDSLDAHTIDVIPAGLLAERIANSGFKQYGIEEAPTLLPSSAGQYDLTRAAGALSFARDGFRKLKGREVAEADRANKAYAHSLGGIFLDPLVPGAATRPYAWSFDDAMEMSAATGIAATAFIVQPDDRPFFIAGGSLVKPVAGAYPRLVPIEYTSLYTGIRQQFGSLGGTYVWPWAYDRTRVAPLSKDKILVGPEPMARLFTLSDVIGSSGAAPQLTLILGSGIPGRLRTAASEAARIFPSFATLTVRDTMPYAPSEELAHGDGGFTDNFGLMPLLARKVRNIMVFVNSADEFERNDGLQTYFTPVQSFAGDGDKTMNVVFDEAHYKELLDGFRKSTGAGGGALYCGKWTTVPNPYYNIQKYTVNVCWIYNYAATNWRTSIPPEISGWLEPGQKDPSKEAKKLVHFPYYATFLENKPELVNLSKVQVNLLAHLAAWSVTNDSAVKAMTAAFGTAVLPPPRR